MTKHGCLLSRQVSAHIFPIDYMWPFAHFVTYMNVRAKPVTPIYPLTHTPTHPLTHPNTLFHYLSSLSKSFIWRTSPARCRSGSERPLRTFSPDLPISPSAYALLLQPCGLLKLSPRAGLGVYDSRDAQSASVFGICLPDCSLSHRAVFLGSWIRQLRGLKKATSINIPPAKICPMVWSVDGTCRQNEKNEKYISMCIYTYMSVSIQFDFFKFEPMQKTRSIFRECWVYDIYISTRAEQVDWLYKKWVWGSKKQTKNTHTKWVK